MEIKLTDNWHLSTDGRQFILRETIRSKAKRDFKNKAGEVVTREGAAMESSREHFFYHLQSALNFMAEQELRSPSGLEIISRALSDVQALVGRVANVAPQDIARALNGGVE